MPIQTSLVRCSQRSLRCLGALSLALPCSEVEALSPQEPQRSRAAASQAAGHPSLPLTTRRPGPGEEWVDGGLDRAYRADGSPVLRLATAMGPGAVGAPAAQDPAAAGPSPQEPRTGYVHIHSTDVADPQSFWFTDRQNIVGEEIDADWDPLKLINTDRPDFTDVAAVVGRGVVQFETGFVQIRRDDGELRQVTETVPNVLVRVGTSDTFEWRLKWRGYTRVELTDLGTGLRATEEGASDTEFGFKWVMGEQHDWLPMQTLVARVNVPVGSPEVTAHRPEPGLSYIYNWQVRRWWFLRGATGVDLFNQPVYSFAAAGGVPVVPVGIDVERDLWLEWSQAFSSYMQVSKRVGIFKEWFMFKRHGSEDDHSDHFHNYGLYLYLTPNVQLDGRIGWRIGDHIDQSLYGLGFSFRL